MGVAKWEGINRLFEKWLSAEGRGWLLSPSFLGAKRERWRGVHADGRLSQALSQHAAAGRSPSCPGCDN